MDFTISYGRIKLSRTTICVAMDMFSKCYICSSGFSCQEEIITRRPIRQRDDLVILSIVVVNFNNVVVIELSSHSFITMIILK